MTRPTEHPRSSTRRDLRRARVRITAVTVLGLLAVLAVTGLVLVRLHERELISDTDAELEAIATGSERFTDVDVPESASTEVPAQIVDQDGRLIYSSPPLEGEPQMWRPGEPTRVHTVDTATHGPHRVIVTPFRDTWLILAAPLQPIDDSVATLRYGLLAAGLPLALIVGLVIWFAVGHALRPVATAAEREERLVADVSHELRSPLAGMRVLLETEPNDPDQIAQTRHDALTTLARMEALADQLLVLTRHQHTATAETHPVDLDQTIHDLTAQAAPRTPITIDTTDVRAGQVLGRADALEQMVDNLIANAIRHARTHVRIALDEHDGTVTLTIDDDGPGVPAPERERIFERFTRLDEARSRTDGGAGLGLAIVRTAVDTHHGTVTVDDTPHGGARFTVRLPASTA